MVMNWPARYSSRSPPAKRFSVTVSAVSQITSEMTSSISRIFCRGDFAGGSVVLGESFLRVSGRAADGTSGSAIVFLLNGLVGRLILSLFRDSGRRRDPRDSRDA